MGKPCIYMEFIKSHFLLPVTRESVSVLQVTWKSTSGTASHPRLFWTCNEIKGSHDKISITIAPSYTGKKYHSFVAVGIVTRAVHSQQYRRQLVIFSSIASYYGDNYIKLHIILFTSFVNIIRVLLKTFLQIFPRLKTKNPQGLNCNWSFYLQGMQHFVFIALLIIILLLSVNHYILYSNAEVHNCW